MRSAQKPLLSAVRSPAVMGTHDLRGSGRDGRHSSKHRRRSAIEGRGSSFPKTNAAVCVDSSRSTGGRGARHHGRECCEVREALVARCATAEIVDLSIARREDILVPRGARIAWTIEGHWRMTASSPSASVQRELALRCSSGLTHASQASSSGIAGGHGAGSQVGLLLVPRSGSATERDDRAARALAARQSERPARRAAVISSRGPARCHAPAFRAPAPSQPRACRRRRRCGRACSRSPRRPAFRPGQTPRLSRRP